MKRKGTKAEQPHAKAAAARNANAGAMSLLSMDIPVGDRFTDHDFESECK
jgi:hypothetical protein